MYILYFSLFKKKKQYVSSILIQFIIFNFFIFFRSFRKIFLIGYFVIFLVSTSFFFVSLIIVSSSSLLLLFVCLLLCKTWKGKRNKNVDHLQFSIYFFKNQNFFRRFKWIKKNVKSISLFVLRLKSIRTSGSIYSRRQLKCLPSTSFDYYGTGCSVATYGNRFSPFQEFHRIHHSADVELCFFFLPLIKRDDGQRNINTRKSQTLSMTNENLKTKEEEETNFIFCDAARPLLRYRRVIQ